MKIERIYLLIILFSTAFVIDSCNLEREINLGDNYYLLGDFENTVISKKSKKRKGVYKDILLGEIKNYNYNDKFIIVNRTINDKVIILFQNHPLWEKQKHSNNQYWIIDKKNNKLIGAMDSLDFCRYKEENKITLDFNK